MAWIEPLALQTWFISVLSGIPEIFIIGSLILITGMCGFFRMTNILLLAVIGIFLFMMSEFVSSPLIALVSIIGGLLVGFALHKAFT